MLHRTVMIVIAAAGLIAGAVAGEESAPGWTSLFDGVSLSGWHIAARPADADKGFWHVEDGTITCDSLGQPNHDYFWLVSDDEYGDFELRLKVRSFRESPGNSGVQVRSRYDTAAGWLDGPQVDIHPQQQFRTGLIYDETRGAKRWIHPSLPNPQITESQAPPAAEWKFSDEGDGWNDVHIKCLGTRITSVINGKVVTDVDFAGLLDDEDHRLRNTGLYGHIALQLHFRDQLRIQYKDIFVRPLDQ
jgi:hypothetical protein